MSLWLFSSHTRKRSRRKTREPYVPVVGDDVIKSVRQARSRHDDVIYPSLLVDDCAATRCRDCACAAGFHVAGESLSVCDEMPSGDDVVEAIPRQRQRRRRTTQLPCCVVDCSCARRSSTQRQFPAVTSSFPTPPPPPPPPPLVSATIRGRAPETRACCGVMSTASHNVGTCTTSFNDDLMLHPPAVVDERLPRTSDVASRNVGDLLYRTLSPT